MLPPSFAVIPCLFYFSIFVHFVYSHVAIQLFYFYYCLDIEDACFDCYCIQEQCNQTKVNFSDIWNQGHNNITADCCNVTFYEYLRDICFEL